MHGAKNALQLTNENVTRMVTERGKNETEQRQSSVPEISYGRICLSIHALDAEKQTRLCCSLTIETMLLNHSMFQKCIVGP